MRLTRQIHGFLVFMAVFSSGGVSWAGEIASAPSFHREIDEMIASGFPRWNVTSPAEPASDAERLRRITLDLTGKIPEANTVRIFLADRDPEKWPKLVDRLLASDAFGRHMAIAFDVMLMERRPDKYVTTPEWREYLAKSFRENKPLDRLAAEILGSDGIDPETRPAAKFTLDRGVDKDLLVRDTGRLFLGVDLQCAQCHDHPTIDDYLHQHYYGLSAFFAGSKVWKMEDGKMALQEMVVPPVEFVSVFKPDVTRKTGPQLPDGPVLEVPEFEEGEEYVEPLKGKVRAVPKFSLRKLLSEELPSGKTPAFARNLANRLWAKMMGRGIVHPLDMHYADNPPSHPELLDRLSNHLVESGFDLKAFLRELALSETYQRSSTVPGGSSPDDIPAESFAVANMKGLGPEELFESLLQATAGDEIFEEQIERQLREGDEDYGELSADGERLAEAREKARAEVLKKFIAQFGALAGTPEDDYQPTMQEALFFANDETISGWLEPKRGSLAEQLLIRDDPRMVAEDAWLSVLSRPPREDEVERVAGYFQQRGVRRPIAVSELIWSLAASAEFRLNH